MYTQHATAKQLKYKNIRYTKFKQLSKMRLLLHLRAYKAQGQCTYLEILLKEKQLTREIFLLDVSQGDDVRIPNQILQEDLSMCYKFYDPMLALTKDEISNISRHYFNLKNQLNVQRM